MKVKFYQLSLIKHLTTDPKFVSISLFSTTLIIFIFKYLYDLTPKNFWMIILIIINIQIVSLLNSEYFKVITENKLTNIIKYYRNVYWIIVADVICFYICTFIFTMPITIVAIINTVNFMTIIQMQLLFIMYGVISRIIYTNIFTVTTRNYTRTLVSIFFIVPIISQNFYIPFILFSIMVVILVVSNKRGIYV